MEDDKDHVGMSQSTLETWEVLGNDPVFKRLIDIHRDISKSNLSPVDICEEIASIVSPTEDRKIEILSFLHPLQKNKFGDKIVWPFENKFLPLYLIGNIISLMRRSGRKARFTGVIKMHKLCYFLKYYKISNKMEFYYEPLHFGAYSKELAHDLKTLENDCFIRVIPKRRRNLENSLHKPFEYELTKRGKDKFLELENELGKKITQTEIGGISDMITYLYRYDYQFLGDASKKDFDERAWTPFRNWNKIDRNELIRYLQEKIQFPEKIYPEVFRDFVEYAPDTSFHPNRVFFFKKKWIPTNYFIPVDYYMTDLPLIRSIARQYQKWLPDNVKNIIVAYDGVSKAIAKEMSRFNPDLKIIGPVMKNGFDEISKSLKSILRPETSCGIFANTTLSGRSLIKLIEELQAINCNISIVIAFADRGCGGSELIEKDKGIKFKTVLSKNDIIEIFKARFDIWEKIH